MNEKVYLHETVDIVGQNRANYMNHMASYAPTARVEKRMLCLGIWGTVGSTERWPEVVNVWEVDGWAGMAANFRHELSNPTLQDPSLAEWWAQAASYRRSGYDRIVVPSPASPTVEEATEQRIHGETYYHELVHVVPGQARDYLAAFEEQWRPIGERLGLRLVGAYRTAMVNDSEVIVISAIDTWERWAAIEVAFEEDREVAEWRRRTASMVVDWRNKLMCAGEHVPMRTGVIL